MSKAYAPSELILNDRGGLYHIGLTPDQVADDVIVVGDPARVKLISAHFDKVEAEVSNREYFTQVGRYNGRRITVMSTGIGTDNIDIAINELDAAVNIDLVHRRPLAETRSLRIIRLGTSGALQADIPVDTIVASEYGLGFDGLMNYYRHDFTDREISYRDAFIYHTSYPMQLAKPYLVEGDLDLRLLIGGDRTTGITATACGFYAPQGRQLRAEMSHPEMNQLITSFSYKEERITNYEMETSALFGLSKMLGHRPATLCAIIANRIRGEYSADYSIVVKKMIAETLERLTAH